MKSNIQTSDSRFINEISLFVDRLIEEIDEVGEYVKSLQRSRYLDSCQDLAYALSVATHVLAFFGRYDEAISTARKIRDKEVEKLSYYGGYRNFAYALYSIVVAYARSGDFEKAIYWTSQIDAYKNPDFDAVRLSLEDDSPYAYRFVSKSGLDYYKEKALNGIIYYLLKLSKFDDAIEIAGEITNDKGRLDALVYIASVGRFNIGEQKLEEIVEQIIWLTRKVRECYNNYYYAGVEIATVLLLIELSKFNKAIEIIEKEKLYNEEVVTAIAGAGLLDSALNMSVKIEDNKKRLNVLRKIAVLLNKRGESRAREIKEEADKLEISIKQEPLSKHDILVAKFKERIKEKLINMPDEKILEIANEIGLKGGQEFIKIPNIDIIVRETIQEILNKEGLERVLDFVKTIDINLRGIAYRKIFSSILKSEDTSDNERLEKALKLARTIDKNSRWTGLLTIFSSIFKSFDVDDALVLLNIEDFEIFLDKFIENEKTSLRIEKYEHILSFFETLLSFGKIPYSPERYLKLIEKMEPKSDGRWLTDDAYDYPEKYLKLIIAILYQIIRLIVNC